MSFAVVATEIVAAASVDLDGIGSALTLANVAAKAANVSPLQGVEEDLVSVINAPTQELLGRPLIGHGANGTATNPDGGAGGILFGNRGNGTPRQPRAKPAVTAGMPGCSATAVPAGAAARAPVAAAGAPVGWCTATAVPVDPAGRP